MRVHYSYILCWWWCIQSILFGIFGCFSLTHRSLRCWSGEAPWEENWLLPHQWSQLTVCWEPVHTEHQLPHAWRYPVENTTAAEVRKQKSIIHWPCQMEGKDCTNPLPYIRINAHNTVERCKSYLNKQRNGVHAGDFVSVSRISGHDLQSPSAAFHDLLHSHSILREREKRTFL